MKKQTIMNGLFILAICLSFLTQPACGPASGQDGQTTETFDRLLIKKATLKSFPAKKPNGIHWDNWAASYDPDIYVVLLDDKDGTALFSNPKNRVENASSNRHYVEKLIILPHAHMRHSPDSGFLLSDCASHKQQASRSL